MKNTILSSHLHASSAALPIAQSNPLSLCRGAFGAGRTSQQDQAVIDRLSAALKNDDYLGFNETTGVVDMNNTIVGGNPLSMDHGTFGAGRTSQQDQAVIDRLSAALKSDRHLGYDETTGVVDMNNTIVGGNPLSIDHGTFGAGRTSQQDQETTDQLVGASPLSKKEQEIIDRLSAMLKDHECIYYDSATGVVDMNNTIFPCDERNVIHVSPFGPC